MRNLFRPIAALAITMTLGACAAPTIWTKPDITQAGWAQDQYSCERDARMSILSFGGGILGAIEAKRFHDRCLEIKGYSRVQ